MSEGPKDDTEEFRAFQAHYDLGLAYIDMRRYIDAIRHLAIACEMRPGDEGCRKALEAARLAQSKRATLN